MAADCDRHGNPWLLGFNLFYAIKQYHQFTTSSSCGEHQYAIFDMLLARHESRSGFPALRNTHVRPERLTYGRAFRAGVTTHNSGG